MVCDSRAAARTARHSGYGAASFAPRSALVFLLVMPPTQSPPPGHVTTP